MYDAGGYVYNVDTYNEMSPTSGDPKYLADSAAAVLAGLQQGDADAVWMMQGWLFLGRRCFSVVKKQCNSNILGQSIDNQLSF